MNLHGVVTRGPGHPLTANILTILNLLAGMLLLISPWSFGVEGNLVLMFNGLLFGLAVMLLATVHLCSLHQIWASWINALIGVWTIIAPWALGFNSNVDMTVNSVVLGVIILGLAIWNVIVSPATD